MGEVSPGRILPLLLVPALQGITAGDRQIENGRRMVAERVLLRDCC